MPTFTFPKPVEDIEEPVLLEEDWYLGEICGKPEIKPNKAMQDDPQSEKAGHNLVVPVKLLEDLATGRRFTLYFPWPREGDERAYTTSGQSWLDKKMTDISQFAESFGGSVEGTDVLIQEGLRGYVYVNQGLDMSGQNIQNSVDIFAGFKAEGAVANAEA